MKRLQLKFPSYDGELQVRVGHGKECVALTIEARDYRQRAGVVLTPEEAWALGTRLRQQAKASQKIEAA